MAVGDKYSVISVANYHNVAVANTWFVDVLDDAIPGDPVLQVAAAFDLKILALVAAKQVSELVYECLLIQKKSPTTEPAVVVDSVRVGALTGDGLPSNQSLCINHVSSDGRPRFRGRWFIPGIRETEIAQGRFTDSILSDFGDFLGTIRSPYGGAGDLYQLNHFSPFAASFTTITRGWLTPIPRKLRNRTRKLCSIS